VFMRLSASSFRALTRTRSHHFENPTGTTTDTEIAFFFSDFHRTCSRHSAFTAHEAAGRLAHWVRPLQRLVGAFLSERTPSWADTKPAKAKRVDTHLCCASNHFIFNYLLDVKAEPARMW